MRIFSFLVFVMSVVHLVADDDSNLIDHPKSKIHFETDIRPILKSACFHCHGEAGTNEANLDVRLVRFLISGGDSGAAIVPGDPEESLLFQRVRDGEMPPEEAHRLTPKQTGLIREWILSGAETLREEPESLEGALITQEEASHWSFQPIVRPDPPNVKHRDLLTNPIDAFILNKLEAKGFTLAETADRRSLIRRVKFDLLGLPPTPEEAESFIADKRPRSYDSLIDEYLASQHYGERWGRHWLDVAGYSDSEGYTPEDVVRPHAWRYRDYVIKSFNDDKPFDQFIVEQLAGDELVTSPMNQLTPEDAELLVATGFLRMSPDGTGGKTDNPELARNDVIAETIKIVSSSLLGMTVGCAQCHDHRYDPIPQTDYYQLRAVFDPAFNWQNWRTPKQRLVSLYTDEDRKLAAEIEARAKDVEAERTSKQNEFISATFEKQLAALPKEIHESARAAYETPTKERTPEQKDLLKKHPSLNVSAGSLYLYDKKAADELKKMADEAQQIRSEKPEERFVRALTEKAGQPPKSHLFFRGDYEQPKDELQAAGLTVVSMNHALPEIPVNNESLKTSGRRLAFARRITDPKHPLTARVIVNRIWMEHFGTGLVKTPADFGMMGTRPTHPKLLDWLACELIDSGWSVKHIHRLIMTSTTYRQSTRRSDELRAVDPENELYGSMNLRRLDAETVRDAILFFSGLLSDEIYGEPVPVMADNSGRWVLGIENLNAGRPGAVIPLKGKEYRRSVYVQSRRSRPLSVLEPFDLPRMNPNCEIRRSSTVTPQSLMLLNSQFSIDYSEKLAARVMKAATSPVLQITTAWKLVYGREPDSSELATAQTFLEEQSMLLPEGDDDEETTPEASESTNPVTSPKALATLCQMLLSSNEFLYLD